MIRSLLDRMRPGDRAFVLVTKGALVRQNERELRAGLVENDWLDAVIQLPAGLYSGHNLPLALMVFEKFRLPSEAAGCSSPIKRFRDPKHTPDQKALPIRHRPGIPRFFFICL